MITKINTIKVVGIEGVPVTCECEISSGIGIHLVGLPDAAVKESLLRTVTALQAYGYHIPGKKIIINLAPTDLHKTGSGYDLAIALGIIAGAQQEDLPELEQFVVLGELGLDGTLRYVPGSVQAILTAKETGKKGCIVPESCLGEFAELFRDDYPIFAAASLREVIDIIKDSGKAQTAWDKYLQKENKAHPDPKELGSWDMIKGNENAKRGLEIAAAGGHNILLVGAPGSMKHTMARAILEILPPLDKEQLLQKAKIYSASGRMAPLNNGRSFRAPHYSASMATFFGGGCGENIMPGEVTLADKGVLLLDEANMLPKSIQETMRATLEDKKITISRLRSKIDYPADYLLVATMNPCPCGYYGEGDRCTCTLTKRTEHLSRLQAPIYDNIAIQIWTHPVSKETILKETTGEPSADVAKRVLEARAIQFKRYDGTPYKTNDEVPARLQKTYFNLDEECESFIEKIITHMGLSARAYSRILKIARTIADLAASEKILPCHMAEAASYRFLDRNLFYNETQKTIHLGNRSDAVRANA